MRGKIVPKIIIKWLHKYNFSSLNQQENHNKILSLNPTAQTKLGLNV